jgi:predicted O-linked N-acetylglucosamine transferase (SPINDLY family)
MNNNIFELYMHYLERNNDIEGIRRCYKYLGMHSIINNNYDDAIYYFNLWQYTYVNYLHVDKYEYDFELLNFIEGKLSQINTNVNVSNVLELNNKIRIVYLLHGILNASSVLPKILLELIKYHDPSIFEIHVFVTESWMQVKRSSGNIFMKQFENSNCQIHYAPFFSYGFDRLQKIIKNIYKINPHIFISTAALAEFDQFFIASMNPAPIRIGFVFAHPAQFISKTFDFGITWIDRIANNCPVSCINSGFTYVPFAQLQEKLNKKDYKIPDDAITIISTGRSQKFQNDQFLSTIISIMKELPNLHYIIVGPSINQIPFLSVISEEIKSRIHIFEWSLDYEKYFSLADIYLDTYPSGGGLTLYDAALLHLPIISFTDSYSNSFNQSDWNPAQDLFPQDSIILVDRNNLSELKLVITSLYNNKDYRIKMGNKAYTSVIRLHNSIKENVKKIENLYIQLINERLNK